MDPWPLIGRDEELALARSALGNPMNSALVLTGEAGVGKTRLAREIVDGAARRGAAVLRAIATVQTRQIPLGAIAPLLAASGPREEDRDSASALARVRDFLSEAADVLMIDDAAHLDDVTAAIVQQLVREGCRRPRLVLTARTEEMPTWLVDLSHDDNVQHLRLQQLGADDVDDLLAAVLDGSVDPQTRSMLWTHSRGNALWLRRLILDGLDTGALTSGEQGWTWHGPVISPDLSALIANRLSWTEPDDRDALELIALGQPLPLPVIAVLDLDDRLARLDARALVEVDEQGVRLAHPLIGSVLRGDMTSLRTRTLKCRLVDAFCRQGAPPAVDLLRVARWQLDTGKVDADLVAEASAQALLLDPDLAESFARAAMERSPSTVPRKVLGRALYEQARLKEARDVFAGVADESLSPDDRIAVLMGLANTTFWGAGDLDSALHELGELQALHPEIADVVEGTRAAFLLFSGEPDAALSVTRRMSADDPRVLLLRAIVATSALAMIGCTGDALELAQAAGVLLADEPEELITPDVVPTFAFAQLHWEYTFALRWAGQIDEAVRHSRAQLDRIAADTIRHPYARALTQSAVGGALLAAGDVRDAVVVLREAAEAMTQWDREGTAVSCLADLARAEALAGNRPEARAALVTAAKHRPAAVHLFDASLGRARAVVAAMSGDHELARDEAIAAAKTARRHGLLVLEAACLHLLVRLGAPERAAPRIGELARDTDAVLVHAFAEHAAAASDPVALESAAGALADAGARMLAAHAAAQAARAWQRTGRDADARRAAHRCSAWAAQCPGAPPPDITITAHQLTARERDIAALAASGMSNQEIANRFVISVRTVESHLEHVYRKLGIAGREELPTMAI